MINITFRKLESIDSDEIYTLLSKSDTEYLKFFHPFRFEREVIHGILDHAKYDMFFGVVLDNQSNHEGKLISFYMLRGLDEGFLYPMYGIFVAAEYQRLGIARLTINHAECICKFYGYKRILLKVYIENVSARCLYESAGFSILKKDDLNNRLIVFYKDL